MSQLCGREIELNLLLHRRNSSSWHEHKPWELRQANMFWKLLNTILVTMEYTITFLGIQRSQFNPKILANCISINIPWSEFRGLEIQTLVYLNLKCKMLPKYWSSMQLHIQFPILGIHLVIVSEFYAPTACQITFPEVSSDVLKVKH